MVKIVYVDSFFENFGYKGYDRREVSLRKSVIDCLFVFCFKERDNSMFEC